jgi:hypothetical protein
MLRLLFRVLSIVGLIRAVRKGPGAVGRRQVRRQAHRYVRRVL